MTPVRTQTVMPKAPDVAEIRRYARCPSGADEELKQCINELTGICGKVCYCECSVKNVDRMVDIEFTQTESKGLSKALDGCEKAVVFAATIGLVPDKLITKYGRISPLKALLVQAVGTERIESVCDAFCEQMQKVYNKKGYTLVNRFSPGYGDLPLGMQKDIFRILDCPRQIGVTLGESLLMMPSKSVTAIIGIKRENV